MTAPTDVFVPAELIVVQASTLCNIDCDYCGLPWRRSSNKASLEDLPQVFINLKRDGLLRQEVVVCWHLGEPTTLPPTYYATAQAKIREAVPDHQFEFRVQTNGVLLDRRWCQLFADEFMGVGVSIDGPEKMNDRRRNLAGKSAYDRARSALLLLAEYKIAHHVIAVLSDAALNDPDSFYRFFKDLGVRELCLNVVESEGEGVAPFLLESAVEDRVEAFFFRLWQLVADDEDPIWIRELAHAQNAIWGGADRPLLSQEMSPGRVITVLWDGRVLPYTPGFATVRESDIDSFVVGNLFQGPLSSVYDRENWSRLFGSVSGLAQRCMSGCEYYSVCGGGSPAHRWAELGTFDGDFATQTCRVSVQAKMRGILRGIAETISH